MQYASTLSWSDGTTTDVSSLGTWSTSDPSVATITASGLATGVKAGQATISISAYGLSFSGVVTVTEATARSLSVSPAELVLSLGDTRTLLVSASTSDGSTRDVTNVASYQAANGAIAEVSTKGVVSARAAGTTTVRVHYGVASTEVSVRVSDAVLSSLSIAPDTFSLNVAESTRVVVTGRYADGSSRDVTTQSSFSVSDANVVSVDAQGQGKGLAAGQAVITASSGRQFAAASVTVHAPRIVSLAVSPANSTVVKAEEAQFIATATYSNGQTGTVPLTKTLCWTGPAMPLWSGTKPTGPGTTSGPRSIGSRIAFGPQSQRADLLLIRRDSWGGTAGSRRAHSVVSTFRSAELGAYATIKG